MKEKILKHVAKLKRVASKKAYLSKSLDEMDNEFRHMQNLMHYPNPSYNGKPVTHERLEQLFLDMCDIGDVINALHGTVEPVVSESDLDSLPF